MPLQLLFIHFRRYQILLLFWYILFATVNGSFMNKFGAHMLFLYPEYLGKVNLLSTLLVGSAVGVFVMCWNITTFILHSRDFKFLAATTQPFLKYCINNAILPLAFLGFYLSEGIRYTAYQELLPVASIVQLALGFLLGFSLVVLVSFLYFFGADRTIYNRLSPADKQILATKRHRLQNFRHRNRHRYRIDWYLSASLRLRQPRNVAHYDEAFLDRIFSQHHLAAVFSVLLVFATLVLAGFWQDNVYLQLPAASSIIVFFAILIAVAGAFSYFLGNWALLFLLLVFLLLNVLYQQNILDPRNKAYGLRYAADSLRPAYTEAALHQAAHPDSIRQDSLQYIRLLNNWKLRQPTPKPAMVIISCSGGGVRAATFTTQVLQQLDSVLPAPILSQAFLVTGASGGMLGAAWYREVYRRQQLGQVKVAQLPALHSAISQDLLNPLFSSFVTRDLLAPAQFFTYQQQRYIKDRGYAFERKLNTNTHGWMDKRLSDYTAEEAAGLIPHLLLSAVITRDGRRLFFANHSVRFLTRPQLQQGPAAHADAIDFTSFFAGLGARQLSFLSALRMSATFPYVLPNVWLPTQPVVDVMDAGFRDNTGLETALRFVQFFDGWIKENCSQVVLLQIRDKPEGGWDTPYESENIFDIVTKPALLTQTNLFHFQEYEQLARLWTQQQHQPMLRRVVFEYQPTKKQHAASLSFHLTRREQQDIAAALQLPTNRQALQLTKRWLNTTAPAN